MDKIRLTLRKILMVALVIWMITVFGLSNQNGTESGNLSRKVANLLAGGDTVKAEKMEPVVRKAAHMTEYATGAMIFYGITLTYQNLNKKKRLIISILFIVFYASTDETHQLFIDRRNGSVVDVFIDTCGGAIGLIGMLVIESAITAIDNKVKEDLENPKIDQK